MKFLYRILDRLVPESEEGLRAQTIQNLAWSGFINISERLLQLVKILIVASIIGPEEFGLMGMALLSIGVLKRFSELGINSALIYNERENIDAYLDTALALRLGRGILLAFMGFLSAPFIASFFGETELIDIIRVISVGPLFVGLSNPGTVYFTKNLKFHKKFIFKFVPSLVGLVVAIAYALVSPTVWALVIGFVSADFSMMILSYLVHNYQPGLNFDFGRAREILSFGKWITAHGMLAFLLTQGDDAFIAWFFSASALGLYQLSYRISNAPATEISETVHRVMFPVFSKIQNNTRKLRESYYKAIQLSAFVTAPMTVGIIVVTPQFVEAFLGAEWQSTVPIIRILAVGGFIRSVVLGRALFQATGHPDYMTKLKLARVTFLALVMYPSTLLYGVEGVAAAIVVTSLLGSIAVNYIIIRLIDINPFRLVRSILYPLVLAVFMGTMTLYLTTRIHFAPVGELLIQITLGVVTYLILAKISMKFFGYDIRNSLVAIKNEIT